MTSPHGTRTFQITGGRALVLLVLLGAFAAFRMHMRVTTLDTEAAAAIRTDYAMEQARATLASAGPGSMLDAEGVESLLRARSVVVRDLRAVGFGDTVLVRANVSLGTDSRSRDEVRYYSMTRSMLTGWRVVRRADRFDFWLQALR